MSMVFRLVTLWTWLLLVLFGGFLNQGGSIPESIAQTITQPGVEYDFAMRQYLQGGYADALRAFRSDSKRGLGNTEGPPVDVICYRTMMGECLFQMGDLSGALASYNSALQIVIRRQGWMQRLQFPDAVQASNRTSSNAIRWGASRRRIVIGSFPERVSSVQGGNNGIIVGQDGVLGLPRMVGVRPHEISRCIATCLRRRREILGALCPRDPLNNRVLQALSSESLSSGGWAQPWLDIPVALAYAASGERATAIQMLRASVQIQGRLDHPLSATALVELGRLHTDAGNYAAAADTFWEATFSAAAFGLGDELEEAFRGAVALGFMLGKPVSDGPLASAAVWARNEKLTRAQTALLILAAESSAAREDTRSAAGYLSQAKRSMRRTNLAASNLGAHYQYVDAFVAYQAGNLASGNRALRGAVAFYQKSSPHFYQIRLLENLYATKSESLNTLSKLYRHLLQEPQNEAWLLDPLMSLSRTITPLSGPLQHWFDVTWQAGNFSNAVEIADRVRGNRFHSRIALGSRLLSLRWILTAPEDILSESRRQIRQQFLNRHPAWVDHLKLSHNVHALWSTLPDEEQNAGQLRKSLAASNNLAKEQELMLRAAALSREPSAAMFPRYRSLARIRERLQPDEVMLIYLRTDSNFYGMLVTKNASDYAHWVIPMDRVRSHLTTLLREMGHYSASRVIPVKQFDNDNWKEISASLWRLMINGEANRLMQDASTVTIVPDNFLWYTPFGALQVPHEEETVPLSDKWTWRVLPAASLIKGPNRRRASKGNVAIVLGELHPKYDAEPEELLDAFSMVGQQRIPIRIPAKSLDAWRMRNADGVVVLHDLAAAQRGNSGWPSVVLKGTDGETALDAWLAFPWAAPDGVVLPGYHTLAENGLQRGADGSEIFTTVCGLMAAGTRTILISQWATGGQSALDFSKEFAQELRHQSAPDALQRTIQLMRSSTIEVAREPRIKSKPSEDPPSANHPFFWSGYLLADSGPTRADFETANADETAERSESESEPTEDPPPKDAPPAAEDAPPANAEPKHLDAANRDEGNASSTEEP